LIYLVPPFLNQLRADENIFVSGILRVEICTRCGKSTCKNFL